MTYKVVVENEYHVYLFDDNIERFTANCKRLIQQRVIIIDLYSHRISIHRIIYNLFKLRVNY